MGLGVSCLRQRLGRRGDGMQGLRIETGEFLARSLCDGLCKTQKSGAKCVPSCLEGPPY